MPDITVTDAEIGRIREKLEKEKSSLSADDSALLAAILKKAEAERERLRTSGGGWYFTWTYTF